MPTLERMPLPKIEDKVCDIASEQLGIGRTKVLPSSRLIEDLQCDSLDLVELIMELEDSFLVTIPNDSPDIVLKSVFTRSPFRLRDLAEIVHLQLGTGKPDRRGWRKPIVNAPADSVPFSQLSGRYDRSALGQGDSLFEELSSTGMPQFRRRTDGMRCVRVPSAEVEIGSARSDSLPDEQPVHTVLLDSFLIDAEPISTMAYCRFLNSVDASETDLCRWVLLDPKDDRTEQMVIERGGSWVGPPSLCRSSYRRGRAPYAMGRCLGFRCISEDQS